MQLILDTSVVVKWYIPEPGWRDAWELKAWLQVEPRHVLVPDLFIGEMANVIWKKCVLLKELPRQAADKIIREALALPFQVLPTASLVPKAFPIAHQFRITIYDALYVAAAEQQRCPLVTADEILIRRLEKHALSHQIVSLAAWKEKLQPR